MNKLDAINATRRNCRFINPAIGRSFLAITFIGTLAVTPKVLADCYADCEGVRVECRIDCGERHPPGPLLQNCLASCDIARDACIYDCDHTGPVCTPGSTRPCSREECPTTGYQQCGGSYPYSWSACICPPPPPPDNVKGSELFCGNQRLYQDDGPYPWTGTPNPNPAIINEGGYAICAAAATVEYPYRATQNFEVRGWVLGNPDPGSPCRDYTEPDHPNDPDEEYFITIALDIDWTPDPPEPGEPQTVALNSLDLLQQYVPGTNVVEFGNRNIVGGHHSPWDGVSIYGGMGSAVIHVEVDGWGPTRGGGAGVYLRHGIPPGWNQCGTENVGGTYFPTFFNQDILPQDGGIEGHGSLSNNDYVSVIGTQWRDDSHIGQHGHPPEQNFAKRCWADTTGGEYWAEMHTADKVRKLDAPAKPARLASSLVAYMGCSEGWTSRFDDTQVLPLPWEHTHIDHVAASISGHSYTAPVPIVTLPNQVRFQGTLENDNGVILSYYQVNWRCDQGWDHCDGITADNCETNTNNDSHNCGICGHACGAGYQCSGGTCQQIPDACNPANCGPQPSIHISAAHCATSSGPCVIDSCYSGWADCDGRSDNGCEINTAFDPTNCGTCGHSCGADGHCAGGNCRSPTCADSGRCGTYSDCYVCCPGGCPPCGRCGPEGICLCEP